MGRHSIITKADVLRIIRLLRWVTRFILVLFFGGEAKRIKALEKLLPAMEREGLLYAEWHKGEKVYSIARKNRVKPVSLEHEIACALILVLLWRCRMKEGQIVMERSFRSFEIVPEAGIRYSKKRGTMLIFEYCTRSNFKHGGVMKSKITRYKKYLPAMEAKFKRTITVLFVIDVERTEVKDFVRKMADHLSVTDLSGLDDTEKREDGSDAVGVPTAFDGGDRFPLDPFFFTDFQTLKSLKVGEALRAKKYFWSDGNEWSLSDND
jgi:hypothetical protein